MSQLSKPSQQRVTLNTAVDMIPVGRSNGLVTVPAGTKTFAVNSGGHVTVYWQRYDGSMWETVRDTERAKELFKTWPKAWSDGGSK